MSSPDLAATDFARLAAAHPDPAFPHFHPRPAQGWINDPNGISHLNGRYHVFFQYNPASARHHKIAWGHLSSADLVRWEEYPVALRPQNGGPDEYGCWTGVVTDDGGVPTAAYSGVRGDGGHSQVVISHGSADLVSWEQDGHVAASMPADPMVTAVRDPFIFRFNGKRYAMQGAGLASGHAALLLYTVEDLSDWKYQGIWLTSENPVAAAHTPAEIWECPQLVRVPSVSSVESPSGGDAWVMMFSLWLSGDDHEHANGVGHLIGSLAEDPATGLPVFSPETGGKSDLGRDFYAPQIVQLQDGAGAGAPGAPASSPALAALAEPKALLWGWANEGPGRDGRRGRSQAEIDAAGWAGVLTHPRLLSVVDGALAVAPAPEVDAYRGAQLASQGAGSVELPAYAEAVVSGGPAALAADAVVELSLVADGSTDSGQVVFSGALAAGEELRVFVDASLVEVYRSGSVATTLRAYPAPDERWVLGLPEGTAADVWKLEQPQ
ncbi:glycoside hydrolase family 32 protein [Pseudarthrobacter cellobiosi]|uniref:glycoside hydrolase family 32 protein n=1 Tax=Pseudarthrobacter cellobiosi TaxID=2953654 RepID=UPI00208F851B|nr:MULTISPECIES: glycoside hydrolase family 32 protein [unclassified Pseudarthrobacter]MCO4253852.1 glycoside hydrolase family 32 protein [Pseudarthrobacter sp. HLT1-5]MCO4276503.1 glycoside hydrolase family 32 protein [Pseudarthrobacter sp. HLT3-5]